MQKIIVKTLFFYYNPIASSFEFQCLQRHFLIVVFQRHFLMVEFLMMIFFLFQIGLARTRLTLAVGVAFRAYCTSRYLAAWSTRHSRASPHETLKNYSVSLSQ